MKARVPIVLWILVWYLSLSPAVAQETAPYFPADHWRTSIPEQQGMVSSMLADAVNFLADQHDYDIHSLLIIRNGYVITDAYFYPYVSGEPHDLASATKSVTATLVGIAIHQGYFQRVGQRIGEIVSVPEDKAGITLGDLLTMRSGIACGDDFSVVYQMAQTADWPQFVLNLPMEAEPGTKWVYCSAAVHLLAGLLQSATGEKTLDFAMQNLFEPIGIRNVDWSHDPQDIVHGWGDLRLTPYDMAKIGYLYLNNGMWDGQQLLPEDWVTNTTHNIRPESEQGYGYLWWLSDDYYAAQGRGGQYIVVVPDKELIVVMTGNGGGIRPKMLLDQFILPAIKSDELLPANAAGELLLQKAIGAVTIAPEVEAHPLEPMPPLAGEVSGRTILLDTNPVGLQTLSLSFTRTAEVELHITNTGFLIGDDEFSWVAGLDGLPRTAPGRFDLPANGIGQWIGGSSFSMHVDEIANNIVWDIHFSFDEENVTIEMDSSVGRFMFTGTIER